MHWHSASGGPCNLPESSSRMQKQTEYAAGTASSLRLCTCHTGLSYPPTLAAGTASNLKPTLLTITGQTRAVGGTGSHSGRLPLHAPSLRGPPTRPSCWRGAPALRGSSAVLWGCAAHWVDMRGHAGEPDIMRARGGGGRAPQCVSCRWEQCKATGPGQPTGHYDTCALDTWCLPSAQNGTQLLVKFSEAAQEACLLNPSDESAEQQHPKHRPAQAGLGSKLDRGLVLPAALAVGCGR